MLRSVPTAKPPVCKIVDYGKYRYELAFARKREARKKKKVIEIKGILLSPNIDTNDLNTKIKCCKEVLTKGDREGDLTFPWT